MKGNLILVIVLLATLLMIDAIPHRRRQIDENQSEQSDFEPCGDYPNPLNATISPVPIVFGEPVNVTVKGTNPPLPIEANSTMNLQIGDNIYNSSEPFCSDEVVCPVATD